MSLRFQDIPALMQFTLMNPRRGLRAVLDLGLPMGARLAALLLMAVVSALLTQASAMLAPVVENPLFEFLTGSPFRTALIQAAGMLLTAVLVNVLGRAWGGQGRLEDAVLAVAWLQLFMVALQLAEMAAIVILLPQLALLVALVSIAAFPWLLTMFVAEVHGFSSPVKVFFGILLCTVGLSFLLSFLLVALLGPETFANV
ncbi:YIP1 family protein [Rhodobacter sp. SGA-6-6]|uniref:YIP1 family protein n=1 Tax=Rhodobacter sp. SGA-6-6 TaxID=2710882 RepID=UPI0013EAAD6C|nr:YIP1 family protein [Rhodobacter sp. SGA-6-6]NGM47647.1 YIP1 family protein [Rhodobacter sp. SGA-6-6]